MKLAGVRLSVRPIIRPQRAAGLLLSARQAENIDRQRQAPPRVVLCSTAPGV